MSPTPEATRPARKPAVALAKIGADNVPLELKVRLTGDLVAAFRDYQRAYRATHSEDIDPSALASHILAAFIDADKGFAAWRKNNPETGS